MQCSAVVQKQLPAEVSDVSHRVDSKNKNVTFIFLYKTYEVNSMHIGNNIRWNVLFYVNVCVVLY